MTTLLDKLIGTFLGIEFREDSIVVTCLKKNLSGMAILSSSAFPLRDDDTVISEVREYIGKQGAEIKGVFVSIPDKWSIIKFTEIPSIKGKSKDVLVNLVRFEIERHIPFQIENVAYDFMVTEEKDMTCSVVFVAVKKERMDFVTDFLEKIQLQPQVVTLSSFAVLNTIELSGVSTGGWQEIMGVVRTSKILGKKGEANISVYIDGVNASLTLIRDGHCTHMRSFTAGEDQALKEFSSDIAEYLAGLQSISSIERFNKLILSGDKTLTVDITGELKEKLSVNNVIVDQVSNFTGDIKGVAVNGLASSVGACFSGFGIGTYGINLLPHKMEYRGKRIAPLTTKIFLVLILFLIIGIFTTGIVKEKKFLTEMEETLKKNEPAVKELEKLSADISVLEKRSGFLRNVKENEITLEILAELTSVLPKDSWITNLDFKGINFRETKKAGGKLIISGYAASSSSLIPLLEDSPFFEKVEFVGPIKKTKDREQFKLSAQVVRPEDKNSETDK